MTSPPTSIPIARYLAIDLHKAYVVIGGVNAQQEPVLSPRRMDLERFSEWLPKNIQKTDAVVLEATTNAWTLYDQVSPYAGKTVIAHPAKVKLIAQARVKTDKIDVGHLARLLAANLIPEVWVPTQPVRELRALLAHRSRLIRTRTGIRNRLHSLLHRHNLPAPEGSAFSHANHSWWEKLTVSPIEQLRLRQDLALLDFLEPQINVLDQELTRLSHTSPWLDQFVYLAQLPGLGVINAMTVLAAIGEISRFPTAKKLVGYAGLGSSVHDSGQTHITGKITKQGRKDLRWVMIEAAWAAVNHHPHWREQFEKLKRRKSPSKAIVAIARKLLVVIWHVLSERAADRHSEPEMVAFKLMQWAWKLDLVQRGGLSTPQFIRYYLMRLKLGEDLSRIHRGGVNRPIASVEELLALHPDLKRSA
jgi:transposase